MHQPDIIHRPALKDGETPVTEVRMAGGRVAKINTGDFWRLIEDGFTGRWVLNGNGFSKHYVRMRCSQDRGGNLVMVARLITRAQPGTVVIYRNGDPLDLRRRNLGVRRLGNRAAKQRQRMRQRCLSATLMVS